MNDLSVKEMEALKKEVIDVSRAWVAHFNAGNVDACLAGYQKDALMDAKPMGSFKGHEAIDGFWRPFVASGATNLVYSNRVLQIIDARTVTLAADWSMNVGSGVITEERWCKDEDGTWRLAYDAFEIENQVAQ